MKNNIANYLKSFEGTTRTKQHLKYIKHLLKKRIRVVALPCGNGKTAIMLRLFLKSSKKRLLIICPTITVIANLEKELTKNIKDIKIICYDNRVKDKNYNLIQDNASIVLLTIDQFLKYFTEHHRSYQLIDYLQHFEITFDEWHETVKTPLHYVFLKYFFEVIKSWGNTNVNLLSATPPLDILLNDLKLDPSDIQKNIPSLFHNPTINLSFHEYLDLKDSNYLMKKELKLGEAAISNSVSATQCLGYLNRKKEKAIKMHSNLESDFKRASLDYILEVFQQASANRVYSLRASKIVQLSLNINLGHTLITDLCPFHELLQRLGRFGRFGEYDTLNLKVCVPKNDQLSFKEFKNLPANVVNHKVSYNFNEALCLVEYLKEKLKRNYNKGVYKIKLSELYQLYYEFYMSTEQEIQDALNKDEKEKTNNIFTILEEYGNNYGFTPRYYSKNKIVENNNEHVLARTLRGNNYYVQLLDAYLHDECLQLSGQTATLALEKSVVCSLIKKEDYDNFRNARKKSGAFKLYREPSSLQGVSYLYIKDDNIGFISINNLKKYGVIND